MKRFISFFYFAIVIVTISSCNYATETSELDEPNSNSDILYNELIRFNDSISVDTRISFSSLLNIVSHDVNGAYRGSKWGSRIGTIFGNPVGGAVIGGLLIGAGASFVAYYNSPLSICNDQSFCTEELYYNTMSSYALTNIEPFEDDSTIISSFEELELPSLYRDVAVYVAAKHNQIISIMESNDTLNMVNFQDALSENEFNIINNQSFIHEFNNTTTDSHNGIINTITLSREMQAFLSAIHSNYCQNKTDLVYLINNYSKIIGLYGNDLSVDEKRSLYIGFAVAYNSYLYWSDGANE